MSAHTALLVFGCLVWLLCSEPAEKPRECACVTALWQGSAQQRVLLNWWRGGEVLVAGMSPEGLANSCSVAVLQGPVMNKHLDKLLIIFSCL